MKLNWFIAQIASLALLVPAASAACPELEGHFVIDKGPAVVSWRYKDSEKAPLFLTEADAATFVSLASQKSPDCPETRYGKDKTHVYFQYQEIAGADAASFEALGASYARDAKRVYWKSNPVKDADLASFEALGDDLARDDKQIYYESQNFPLKSHKKLAFGYQTLGSFVLFERSKVEGADAASFEALGPSRARDAKAIYFGDQRMPRLDRATYRTLGSAFYADKNGVRSAFEVSNGSDEGIPGLDPSRSVPIEQSSYKKLAGPCREQGGQVRCLTDGTHLIAIVKIGQLGSQELKVGLLKSVKTDSDHLLQFGSEVFDHLNLVEDNHADIKNLHPASQ